MHNPMIDLSPFDEDSGHVNAIIETPKGSRNKASALREKLVAAGGKTPLDYLLAVMRDETNDRATRIAAASTRARSRTRSAFH